MRSVKHYMLTSVWVSEELAARLIAEGYANPDYAYQTSSHSQLIRAYEWKLNLGYVFLRGNCITTAEDELALQLMLLPTDEARLEYLNAN